MAKFNQDMLPVTYIERFKLMWTTNYVPCNLHSGKNKIEKTTAQYNSNKYTKKCIHVYICTMKRNKQTENKIRGVESVRHQGRN